MSDKEYNMHELSITEHLLSLTLKHANDAGAKRVVSLSLVIGEFSSVVDESIQFYWDMMTEGTVAEGATLHFDRIQGVLECVDCGATFTMQEFESVCPSCEGLRTRVLEGDQFQLKSLEIE